MNDFLTSVVIAAFVSAIVTLLTSEKRIAVDTVVRERTKWRQKIRDLASEVHGALSSNNSEDLPKLKSRFSLLLNPDDKNDNRILALIKENGNADDFNSHVALLLKHDWERTKYEASFWRLCTRRKPERAKFGSVTPHEYRSLRQIPTLTAILTIVLLFVLSITGKVHFLESANNYIEIKITLDHK